MEQVVAVNIVSLQSLGKYCIMAWGRPEQQTVGMPWLDASAAVRHPEVRFPLGWAGGNY